MQTFSLPVGPKKIYKFSFRSKHLNAVVVAVSNVDMARLIACNTKRRLELFFLAAILTKSHEGRADFVVFSAIYNKHIEGAVFDGFVLDFY